MVSHAEGEEDAGWMRNDDEERQQQREEEGEDAILAKA